MISYISLSGSWGLSVVGLGWLDDMEESKEELETSEVDQLRRLSVIADGVPVIQYSVLWKVSPIVDLMYQKNYKLAAVSSEIYRGGGHSARSNDGGIRYQ